jgi:hypothetical protein
MACRKTIPAALSHLRRNAIRFRIILLSLFLLPLFCGCVTSIPQSRIDISSTKEIPANETVVFGRVKVSKDGKVLGWKPHPKVVYIVVYRFWPDFFTLFVKEEATKKEFVYRLTDDGSFYWRLPAGTYAITGYRYVIGPNDVESHFPPGLTPRFVISKSDSADYIGTLSIEVHPIGNDVMRIEDDYGQAVRDLKSEFPAMVLQTKKGLMTFH